MTIQQLYDWAIQNSVEDFKIEIQYRDEGGYYAGSEELDEDAILINGWLSKVVL